MATVSWERSVSVEEWLMTQPHTEWKQLFDRDGCLVIENLLSSDEVEKYKDIYKKMLSGEIDTSNHRNDLGNHEKPKMGGENICQIMWPSLYVEGLSDGPLKKRSETVARTIYGPDMGFDFEMMISKAPQTNTPTPWHQDESYWPDMPDKRAISFWVAMDESTIDNGCMWFVPGSHKQPIRKHRPVKEGCHVLMCDGTEDEGSRKPLKPGSCTLHHGLTVHYSRGNTTDTDRRAYIVNYRPEAMVQYERDHGFDHGKKGLKGILAASKTHKPTTD